MLLSSEEKRKKGQSNVEEALSFLFFVDGCWFSPCELLSLMTRSTLIHKDWKIASVQRRPSSFLNDVTLDVTSRFGRMAECFRVSNVTFVWAVFFFLSLLYVCVFLFLIYVVFVLWTFHLFVIMNVSNNFV